MIHQHIKRGHNIHNGGKPEKHQKVTENRKKETNSAEKRKREGAKLGKQKKNRYGKLENFKIFHRKPETGPL